MHVRERLVGRDVRDAGLHGHHVQRQWHVCYGQWHRGVRVRQRLVGRDVRGRGLLGRHVQRSWHVQHGRRHGDVQLQRGLVGNQLSDTRLHGLQLRSWYVRDQRWHRAMHVRQWLGRQRLLRVRQRTCRRQL